MASRRAIDCPARSTPQRALLSNLPPVMDARTEILILGSFPSAASLRAGQYYGHPRNQFWQLVGSVLNEPLPHLPYPERLAKLLEHRIGLWDVLRSCQRLGSLDHRIRAAEPNDFAGLARACPRLIACVLNGTTAQRLAAGRLPPALSPVLVPSSSAAHASLSIVAKEKAWRQALRRSDDVTL